MIEMVDPDGRELEESKEGEGRGQPEYRDEEGPCMVKPGWPVRRLIRQGSSDTAGCKH